MKQYSIVVYLEGEVKKQVREMQEKLFDITGSRACIDAWEPHMTVGDGILVSKEELVEVESNLQKIVDEQKNFYVPLWEQHPRLEAILSRCIMYVCRTTAKVHTLYTTSNTT